MDISEIYQKFDQIGCLTFATINKDSPQTRIAHLRAHDHEGLYFQTMITKAFYHQLKKTGKVSICGMYPKTYVSHDEQEMPYFEPGYTLRVTGDVREVSFEALKAKAADNEMFMLCVKDIERYPAMTTFCIRRAWGKSLILILKWNAARISYCGQDSLSEGRKSRSLAFALRMSAFSVGNVWKSVPSKQFINMGSGLQLTTQNATYAGIVLHHLPQRCH